jgi:hypothetical protein
MKSHVVFSARNPLFADRKGNLAITKQARADVMVVDVDSKDIDVRF